MPMKIKEKKLTVVQASEICGVTRTTVWRWIKTGKLESAKTAGGHHRIKESTLLGFMDQNNMHTTNRSEVTNRILIVDDDLKIQKLLNKVLKRDDIELEFASDGFDAGTKLYKFKPDLIILDLFMPKVDGFKVCEQIRNDQETSKIKIIAISGYDTKENREKILRIGADYFLPKPIDHDHLIQTINELFKEKLKV